MSSKDLPEMDSLLNQIVTTQGNWGGLCARRECYWNMWNPVHNPNGLACVSESLGDMKMSPNLTSCPSYWDYEVACGRKKGE